jgi:hypothetical protein
VQFKLTKSDTVQRKTDTTTTTTVTKVPSFKSIGSDSESHNDWAALTHVPPSGTTVASLTDIRSDFDWLNGSTNHTGSLRWVISTPAGNIDAYYGSLPNFTDNGGPGSGDNLIAQTDARFDPPGGEWVKTWNDIVGTYGTQPVLSVYLVVDAGDQELDLHGATVNGSHKGVLDSYTGGHDTVEAWSPGQPDVVTVPGTWETISTSAGVQTNAVPAKIVVIKSPNDPTPIDVASRCHPPRATPRATSARSTASTRTTSRPRPSARAASTCTSPRTATPTPRATPGSWKTQGCSNSSSTRSPRSAWRAGRPITRSGALCRLTGRLTRYSWRQSIRVEMRKGGEAANWFL